MHSIHILCYNHMCLVFLCVSKDLYSIIQIIDVSSWPNINVEMVWSNSFQTKFNKHFLGLSRPIHYWNIVPSVNCNPGQGFSLIVVTDHMICESDAAYVYFIFQFTRLLNNHHHYSCVKLYTNRSVLYSTGFVL